MQLVTTDLTGSNVNAVTQDGQVVPLIPVPASALQGVEGAVVASPNTVSSFAGSFVPGTTGSLLAVIDITPVATGLLTINVDLGGSCLATAADGALPELLVFVVADLTAVTGGTELVPGLTLTPTSTTPAASGGVTWNEDGMPPFTVPGGGPNDFFLRAFGVFQGTVGTRYGVCLFVADKDNTNTWGVGGQFSVVERSSVTPP